MNLTTTDFIMRSPLFLFELNQPTAHSSLPRYFHEKRRLVHPSQAASSAGIRSLPSSPYEPNRLLSSVGYPMEIIVRNE